MDICSIGIKETERETDKDRFILINSSHLIVQLMTLARPCTARPASPKQESTLCFFGMQCFINA